MIRIFLVPSEVTPVTPTKEEKEEEENNNSFLFETATPFSREDKKEIFEEPEEEGERFPVPQSSQDGEGFNEEKTSGAPPACSANAPQRPGAARARGRGNRAGRGGKRQPRQPERERKAIPLALVEHILHLATGDLNDAPKSVKSNIAKVGNLYHTLLAVYESLAPEQIEQYTIDVLYHIRDEVKEVEDGKIKYTNGANSFIPNRMPLFWSSIETALVEQLNFTDKQLELYTSKEAMYA